MNRSFTNQEIENALKNMQGFVDVTASDVQELLHNLKQVKKTQVHFKRKPLRYSKLLWISLIRSTKVRSSTTKRVGGKEIFFSWILSFLGIATLGLFNVFDVAYIFIIGSFGASAVLLYGAPRSSLSQPRNLIGGHVVSALIGVSVHLLIPDLLWLSAALAVSVAIVVMHATKTLHPPGGATALIAVIGGEKIYALGFSYVLHPVFLGALVMLVIAWIGNNSVKGRRYPVCWF